MKAGSFDDCNDFSFLSADFGFINFVLPTFAKTKENESNKDVYKNTKKLQHKEV